MYYVVVGGWVAKYAFQYIVSGDFGSDKQVYFDTFTSSTIEPLIWLRLSFICVHYAVFRDHKYSGKIAKVMMPVLFALLIICGIWHWL